jgi:8-oxo-dGTP pyrophosphatase MutT (NUDIX family)
MLDNLVGGGIGWGYSIAETLLKECWEESGIAAPLAAQAVRGRTLHVLQEIEQGTQAEQLFVFDLVLPADFSPANQDGEVADHRLARLDEVLAWISAGAMTVDASLATLDCLLRHGWLEASFCAGLEALCQPPEVRPAAA